MSAFNRFTILGAVALAIGMYFALTYSPDGTPPGETSKEAAVSTGVEIDTTARGVSAGAFTTEEESTGEATEVAAAESSEGEPDKDAEATPAETAPKVPAPAYSTPRSKFVKSNPIPEEYATLTNPLEATVENLSSGAALYATRCALCHGQSGLGDGVAGMSLRPPASNLALLAAQKEITDTYLFWALSEGGSAIKSSMPAFKSTKENDRWLIVLHMQKGMDWQDN